MNASPAPTDAGEVIRRHSRSFSLAAKLLAPEQRRRAELLYAWCRTADDAVDRATSPAGAAEALEALRAEVRRVYEGGTPDAPTGLALAEVVAQCGLPQCYPDELLDGMAMDIGDADCATEAELLVYCHRVAGVVGLMMCHALGVADDAALAPAAYLGIGMQLTNIARDVAEDRERGRRYIPSDWLAVVPTPGDPLDDAIYAPAVERLLALARRYDDAGRAGLKYLDRRSGLGVRVASAVYGAIGDVLAARGHRVSMGRAVVSRGHKLRLLARSAVETAFAKHPRQVRLPGKLWAFVPLSGSELTGGLDMKSNREAFYLMTFALALTLLMGTGLFVMVGLNPNRESFGNLPWVYAGLSLAGSVVLWVISGRLAVPANRVAETKVISAE